MMALNPFSPRSVSFVLPMIVTKFQRNVVVALTELTND